MTAMKRNFLTASIVALGAIAFSATAAAASPAVDAAKAKCVIGEQYDGYLGVIDAAGVDEALRREVRSINLQRKGVYADLATRNGVTVEVAASLTAERLMNSAPSGHCVLPGAGQNWVKKP
jgi:uncharacterized protein YdbL (DUF1318 family)